VWERSARYLYRSRMQAGEGSADPFPVLGCEGRARPAGAVKDAASRLAALGPVGSFLTAPASGLG